MIKRIFYTAIVLIVLVAAATLIYGNVFGKKKPAEVPQNNSATPASEQTAEDSSDDSDALPGNTFVKQDGILIGPGFTVGEAPEGYFSDALFVGDSRFVGLEQYGRLDGSLWYCSTGMGLSNYNDKGVKVSGYGTIKLESLLKKKSFGKIYLCLGINDLGYNLDKLKTRFSDFVAKIQELNPDALLILVSNLHVGASRSATDKWVNNSRLDELNGYFESMQDGERIFYLDTNCIFDDADGNMDSQYTHDGTHVTGKYYKVWGDYIKAHAVIGE